MGEEESIMLLKASQIEVMDDAMVEVLRAKTPAERLAIADGMWRSARRIIRFKVQADNPSWPDERVDQETARRLSHGAVGTA